MTPQELKRANIERFKRLISEAGDEPTRRERLESLLVEEQEKPLGDYPKPD